MTNGYMDNYVDVQPTVDRSMDTRLEMSHEEFLGKGTRGVGMGGPKDPLTPWHQDKPNVMHVNDVGKATFDDSRSRALETAIASFKRTGRHDRQIGPLHPMDYEPDPSVGHRQVDRPEYTQSLYTDRYAQTSVPSEKMKQDTILPGPADTDSGFRRTVDYKPALFVPRPIMRDVRNDSVKMIPQREVQAATMQDLGKSDNPLFRQDPFHGVRKKVELSKVDSRLIDNLPHTRAVTRDASAFTDAKVADANRDIGMAAARNGMRMLDNVAPGDRSFFDYYDGDQEKLATSSPISIAPALHDPVGSDYSLVPTGRAKVSGVGSGLAGMHTSIPTHMPVRKPQWSTSMYKHTNLMDAQRVFGQGKWGFGTPVRSSTNRGVFPLMRVEGRRRVGGYERPQGLDGVADYMLGGTSTRGRDHQGGKSHSTHDGVRQPVRDRRGTATARSAVGEFAGTKRQLPMDTIVGTRGGELWSVAAQVQHPFAVKHEAYYSARDQLGITADGMQGEAKHDSMHSYINKEGGFLPNPPAEHPGTAHHSDLHTKFPPRQLTVR